MSALSYSEADERSPFEKSIREDSALRTESDRVEKQEHWEPAGKIGCDSERIISSVALYTSKSIKELEGLTSELHELQEFLKSETERVQRDIDNALAGLKIIMSPVKYFQGVEREG